MLRKRLAKTIGGLAILIALLAVTVAPSAAYYNEIEGVRWFDLGQSGKGCEIGFYVLQGMRAQVFCDVYQPWNGVRLTKTNYIEYDCPDAWGCWYSAYINGTPGAYPLNVSTRKKDWNAGQHTLIYTYYQR